MSSAVWTIDAVRALGARTDGVTACKIVYGVGRTKAYQLLASGQVDFKLIRVPGAKAQYVVPVSSILRLLSDNVGDP